MTLSPDEIVFWKYGFIKLNATIVYTWAIMFIMVVFSIIVTRKLVTSGAPSRKQSLLEVIVQTIRSQIADISQQKPDPYVAFVGTLFLFIAVSNILSVVPFFMAPTGSLYTTAALATCVAVAVPIYGIWKVGIKTYLENYIKPSVFMLPFNIMGELSRTLALAVRLFGNIMSGSMIAGILISIVPFIFPTIMDALGLLTGLIQAYIFAVLAMVYIASATRTEDKPETQAETNDEKKD